AELPQRREHASGRRASGHGGARSRRIGRVQVVYVEGNIGLEAASSLDDRIGEVGCAHLVYLVAVDDLDAACLRSMGTDAHLNRSVRIDETFPDGAAHEGTMVDALAIVRPGILVGIELNQVQRAMNSGSRR